MVNKRKVAVLGATGMMGQKFVQLLSHHSWFEVSGVAASDKSVGKTYASSIGSGIEASLPDGLGGLVLSEPNPRALNDPDIAFSALLLKSPGRWRQSLLKPGCQCSPTHHRTEWTSTSHS